MTIQQVWAVYFSGTGTTRQVVTALAGQLAQGLGVPCREFCFNPPAARQQRLDFGPDDLVIVGLPTYAGRVPNLLLPWLQTGLHGENTPAVPVVLFGNRDFDDALMELHQSLSANGFCPLAGAAIVGQHAFSRTLGAGRPDADDLALVTQLGRRVAQKLRAGDLTPAAVAGCDPIRPYYVPRDRQGQPIRDFLKATPDTLADRCTNCGLCAGLCPMGSIDPKTAAVTGKCIKCNACVKACPTGAKVFTHEGYLYHKQELEQQYGQDRAESRIFY